MIFLMDWLLNELIQWIIDWLNEWLVNLSVGIWLIIGWYLVDILICSWIDKKLTKLVIETFKYIGSKIDINHWLI